MRCQRKTHVFGGSFWMAWWKGLSEKCHARVCHVFGQDSWQHMFTQMHQYCFQLPARFLMESMNGKALEKYLCSKPSRTMDFLITASCRLMWYQDKPKGYPSIHEMTRIFLGGNQTWCTCFVLVNLEGLPWKIVHGVNEVKATQINFWIFTPKLGEENHPSWLRRTFLFRWVGKKTHQLGLGWFYKMTKPYVFLLGGSCKTSGSCGVDLGPSWYQQFFSTISEDGPQRGAEAVDGKRNPAFTHSPVEAKVVRIRIPHCLRRVLAPSQVVIIEISSINLGNPTGFHKKKAANLSPPTTNRKIKIVVGIEVGRLFLSSGGPPLQGTYLFGVCVCNLCVWNHLQSST